MSTPSGERGVERDADVNASEVAAYAYCAKAWHLERVLGMALSAGSVRRCAVGVERHAVHGTRVAQLRTVGPALAWGAVALLALAAVLVGVLLLLTVRR